MLQHGACVGPIAALGAQCSECCAKMQLTAMFNVISGTHATSRFECRGYAFTSTVYSLLTPRRSARNCVQTCVSRTVTQESFPHLIFSFWTDICMYIYIYICMKSTVRSSQANLDGETNLKIKACLGRLQDVTGVGNSLMWGSGFRGLGSQNTIILIVGPQNDTLNFGKPPVQVGQTEPSTHKP